jgi:hypothetical protein
MLGKNSGAINRALSFIAIAVVFSATPALSAATASDSGKAPAAASSSSSSEPKAKASPAAKTAKTLKQKVKSAAKAVLAKITPERRKRDVEFKKAAALFPSFCKDWERKLHDREINNQTHIAWQMKDGWDTGTYVGYGKVQKCECHQSTDGYSIGKVGYDEFQYYVTGKTEDEAKHATPKVTETTTTTELFRWDKNKWFY